jgi:hypothetical protein
MALSPADLPVRITIDVDGSGGTDMIKRHPLVIFTVLTFGLTWIVWMPRAAGVPVGAVGQLWTWIPAVAAASGRQRSTAHRAHPT